MPDKNREIEELKDDLLKAYRINKLYSSDVSEYLYEQGYRKASDVAREIFEEIDNILDFLKLYNPCDDLLKAVIYRIAELKKKFTEGGE